MPRGDTVDNLDNFTLVAWKSANDTNDAGNPLVLSTTDADLGPSAHALTVSAHEEHLWSETDRL